MNVQYLCISPISPSDNRYKRPPRPPSDMSPIYDIVTPRFYKGYRNRVCYWKAHSIWPTRDQNIIK